MLVRRLSECPEFISGDKAFLREILHPDKAPVSLRYSLAWARVPAGTATAPHRLEHSEVYYILQGRGVMHVGAEVCEVGSGDTVYIPPVEPQFIESSGPDELVFLCIVDPAWREEIEVVQL
ncbi:MAG TPA: cupin domain-containing protein [Armatimonadota bacterium]|nr:cupin domain-containing protein [Armatimonadota bacterium]